MSSVGPNFRKILTETIKRAGVEDDSVARAGIYSRARRTVVDRARASGAGNVSALEAEIDAAISEIEAEFNAPPPLEPLASPKRPEIDTGLTQARGRTSGPEPFVVARQGNAALAMSLPEPDPAVIDPDMAATARANEPERAPDLPETPAEAEVGTAETENADAAEGRTAAKENVFPIWRKLRLQREAEEKAEAKEAEPAKFEVETSETTFDFKPIKPVIADDVEPEAPPRRKGADAFFAKVAKVGAAKADPEPSQSEHFADTLSSSLDRIAADIAAGFREFTHTDSPKAGASESASDAETSHAVDEIALAEPDEALVRDVDNLVKDTGNDNSPDAAEIGPKRLGRKRRRLGLPGRVTRPSLPSMPTVSAPKLPSLPKVAMPRVNAGLIGAAAVALLVVGAGTYFALNPLPANPAFAVAASGGLLPDRSALDGEGWVARDATVTAVAGLWPNAYEIRDTSDERFGSIAAPLNDIAAPKGFRVTVRLLKSEKRLTHFAALRITAPYTRQPYTIDAMLDLTTGEAAAKGNARDEDIAVIDDGDSWRLTLAAPLEGKVLFSKPRLEIFAAAGTNFGRYDPAATGAITVGDVSVEPL